MPLSDRGSSSSRRTFLQALGLGAAGATLMSGRTAQAWPEQQSSGMLKPGDVVLFQGDSITDAGRKRDLAEPNHQPAFGGGYAWMAASHLLVEFPEHKFQCYNRGLSGNKVHQLAARWQSDCLDLKPNLVSILVGVNDLWHRLSGKYDGTIEDYVRDFRALLDRTRSELPSTKLVICEPFVLPCGAVNDSWFPAFEEFQQSAAMLAREAGAAFVPFQQCFDRAVTLAPPEHWAADGVHPTPHGAALMAHFWLRTVLDGHAA